VNPADTEWLNATRPEFGGELQNHRLRSVFIRPIIEVIDDFDSDEWEGFVCLPMHISKWDYQDTERWWL
jgi:hypothetical protein